MNNQCKNLIILAVIFIGLLAISPIPSLAAGLANNPAGDPQVQRLERIKPVWTFQGRVYKGKVGEEMRPLQGVEVSLYGANNAWPAPGKLLRTTVTDHKGWYGLKVYSNEASFEFYRIRETDPAGYISVGAAAVHGKVKNKNCIEYDYPLRGKTLTGNKFWDNAPGEKKRERERELERGRERGTEREREREQPRERDRDIEREREQERERQRELEREQARERERDIEREREQEPDRERDIEREREQERERRRELEREREQDRERDRPRHEERPRINEIHPIEGRCGEEMNLIIRGSGFGERPEIMIPEGIEIRHVRFISPEELEVSLIIMDEAPPGPRPMEIVFPGREPAFKENAFTVICQGHEPKEPIQPVEPIEPVIPVEPVEPKVDVPKLPEILLIGDFTLYVDTYTDGGQWDVFQKNFKNVSGTAWLSFDCGSWFYTVVELGDQAKISNTFKVVQVVTNPRFEISVTEAQQYKPGINTGATIQLAKTFAEPPKVSYKDLEPLKKKKGDILVYFENVTIVPIPGKPNTGRITVGQAVYPTESPVPKIIKLTISGFTALIDNLVLTPGVALANIKLQLPDSIVSVKNCDPAILELGKTAVTPKCEFYKKIPSKAFGTWLVGDTGMAISGIGFTADFMSSKSPLAKPASWKGVLLHKGTATGSPLVPNHSNTGYLAGSYSFTNASVTQTGFDGQLTLSKAHTFYPTSPEGYSVNLQGGSLKVSRDTIVSGQLGPGHVILPTTAVCKWNPGSSVTIEFSKLTVQKDLDLAGVMTVDPGTTIAWGELTHKGDEVKAWQAEINSAYFYLPSGPKSTFSPDISSGFFKFSKPAAAPAFLTQLESLNMAGVTVSEFKNLAIYSPDNPFGTSSAITFKQIHTSSWLHIGEQGVDGEIRVDRWDIREKLGNNKRTGYKGKTPFDMTWNESKYEKPMFFQYASSAVYDSEIDGFVKIPLPCNIPKLVFKDLETTSTANFVGGRIFLPTGGITLDYWKLQLVPTGAGNEAGVVSVRTGRLVFTAAGISEKVHFATPFGLTWGEILADGNIKNLVLNHNSYGQKFDGLSFVPHNLVLSKYIPNATNGYMDVCGTLHFNFFGSHFANIRDARYDKNLKKPHYGRYVTVPKKGDASGKSTDLHLQGQWNNKRATFDFPDATMDYNKKIQEGFIGKGTGTLKLLSNAKLTADIEVHRDATDICLTSTSTQNIDLGLFAHLGGINQLFGCVRIEGPTLKRIAVNGYLEKSAGTGAGIVAPKTGYMVETNMSITPTSTTFYAAGTMFLTVAGSAVDLSGYVRLSQDYAKKSADGEMMGKVDCNSILGGLSGSGQMTWHVDPNSQYFQGKMRVAVCSWIGGGGLEGGFFIGHNVPKSKAWILTTGSEHFGVSDNILPAKLTGLYGYGQLSLNLNLYVFGGGIDLYAGMGAFTTTPTGCKSAKDVISNLPYVLGSAGVNVHGEILGGLVSASAWGDLTLRGPIPYFEGSFGLEGCVLWVICASIDVTAGISPTRGFYLD